MQPVEELRYLILATQREGARALAAALVPHGLTPAQAEALAVLRDAGKPLTTKEVGDRLVCEQGSPSRLMSTLVNKRLLVSAPHPGDRRASTLRLTPAGRAAVRRVTTVEQGLYETIGANLDRGQIDAVRGTLWDIVGDLPAGRALARRAAERGRDQQGQL